MLAAMKACGTGTQIVSAPNLLDVANPLSAIIKLSPSIPSPHSAATEVPIAFCIRNYFL